MTDTTRSLNECPHGWQNGAGCSICNSRPHPDQSEISVGMSQLEFIARTIKGWLEWDKGERSKENITTEEGTHIMALPVPFWPTHGMLENWIAVLREADKRLRTTEPVSGKCRCNEYYKCIYCGGPEWFNLDAPKTEQPVDCMKAFEESPCANMGGIQRDAALQGFKAAWKLKRESGVDAHRLRNALEHIKSEALSNGLDTIARWANEGLDYGVA